MNLRSALALAGAIKPAARTSAPTVAQIAASRGVSLSFIRRERATREAPKALAALAQRQQTRETLAAITQRLQARGAANAVLQALNSVIRSRS